MVTIAGWEVHLTERVGFIGFSVVLLQLFGIKLCGAWVNTITINKGQRSLGHASPFYNFLASATNMPSVITIVMNWKIAWTFHKSGPYCSMYHEGYCVLSGSEEASLGAEGISPHKAGPLLTELCSSLHH